MSTMNTSEARLRIHTLISEALFAMTDGPDLNEAGRDDLREDMANATDMVLEVLQLTVESVEETQAKVSIQLEEPK